MSSDDKTNVCTPSPQRGSTTVPACPCPSPSPLQPQPQHNKRVRTVPSTWISDQNCGASVHFDLMSSRSSMGSSPDASPRASPAAAPPLPQLPRRSAAQFAGGVHAHSADARALPAAEPAKAPLPAPSPHSPARRRSELGRHSRDAMRPLKGRLAALSALPSGMLQPPPPPPPCGRCAACAALARREPAAERSGRTPDRPPSSCCVEKRACSTTSRTRMTLIRIRSA
eukprot:42494-Chlamydomonas_euryale.AAC.2